MTRILGVASSIAVSLIISWAALHYDSALLVTGLVLLFVVTILWIFVGPADAARRPPTPLRRDEARPELDPQARALFYLARARENGYTAHQNRSRPQIDQSLNEIFSALSGVAKAFSFGSIDIEAEGLGRRRILGLVLNYVDSFYFLLQHGHVTEARKIAATFEKG
jgi:hypothetical protein